jgi:hypothetical protein
VACEAQHNCCGVRSQATPTLSTPVCQLPCSPQAPPASLPLRSSALHPRGRSACRVISTYSMLMLMRKLLTMTWPAMQPSHVDFVSGFWQSADT